MTEQLDLFPRNRENLLTTTKATTTTATVTTHPTLEAVGFGFGNEKRIGTGEAPAEYRKRDRVRSSAPRNSRTSANARDAEYQVRLRRTGQFASPAQRPPVAVTRSTARQNTRASTLFCLVRTRGVIKIKLFVVFKYRASNDDTDANGGDCRGGAIFPKATAGQRHFTADLTAVLFHHWR